MRLLRFCLLCAAVPAFAAPDLEELRKKAETVPASQVELGRAYLLGTNGVRPNPEQAAWWFRRASRSGSPSGNYHLGVMYEQGWGVTKNLHAACDCYRRAVSFPAAALRLADLFFSGIPEENGEKTEKLAAVPPEPETAMAMLRKLSADGYLPGTVRLTERLYAKSKRTEAEETELRNLALSLARHPQAEPPALFAAARVLKTFSPEEARRLLRRAAQADYPPAMTELARLLEVSAQNETERLEALHLIQRAAGVREPGALLRLGQRHLAGDAVDFNPVKGARLVRQAAELKYPAACSQYGYLRQYGIGVEADAEDAFLWYEKGSRLGDSRSQYLLGCCYRDGSGVEADPTAAVFWFKCAGAAGEREAIRELGIAYLHGRGVPENRTEGLRLIRAAAAGDAQAADLLN